MKLAKTLGISIAIFLVIFLVMMLFMLRSLNRPLLVSTHPVTALIVTTTKHKKPVDQYIRVLAIDGGGIRGIIPLHVLTYIEKKSGKPISELFDVIVGTSTGTIISTMLTVPNAKNKPRYSAKQVLSFYNALGPKILITHWYHRLITVDGYLGPKYNPIHFDKLLKKTLGANTRFDQLLSNVIITTYDLRNQRPILFKSWLAGRNNYPNYYLFDLVAGATATPMIFPPRIVYSLNHQYSHVLIDGGLYSNDPAMIALIHAMKIYPNHKYLIVSLGTGIHIPKLNPREIIHWGAVQWIKDFILIMFQSDPQITAQEMSQLAKIFPRRIVDYYRFTLPISAENFQPFNTSKTNMEQLNKNGETIVKKNQQTLDKLITRLDQ